MNRPPAPPPPPPGWPPTPERDGAGQGANGRADPPFTDPVDLRARSAAAAFRVPFSIVDAFAAIAAYFLGQLVVGVAFGIGLLLSGAQMAALEGATELALTVVALVVGGTFAVGYLALRRRLTWRLLGPVRPGWLTVALGLGVGLGGTFTAYLINFVLALIFDPQDPVEQQVIQEILAGGGAMVLAIIIAVVFAPLLEELLFRGLLFQSLRRRLGLWPAALLSALVFTVIHVEVIRSQPLALVGLFTLGVVFAWTFHRTGSLLVPTLAHAVFNGISVVLAIVVDRLGLDVGETLTAVAALLAPLLP